MLTVPPSQELGLNLDWLFLARGDFQRAANALRRDIENSDKENKVIRRALNDRIMKVGACSWFASLCKGRELPGVGFVFGSCGHCAAPCLLRSVNVTNCCYQERIWPVQSCSRKGLGGGGRVGAQDGTDEERKMWEVSVT